MMSTLKQHFVRWLLRDYLHRERVRIYYSILAQVKHPGDKGRLAQWMDRDLDNPARTVEEMREAIRVLKKDAIDFSFAVDLETVDRAP